MIRDTVFTEGAISALSVTAGFYSASGSNGDIEVRNDWFDAYLVGAFNQFGDKLSGPDVNGYELNFFRLELLGSAATLSSDLLPLNPPNFDLSEFYLTLGFIHPDSQHGFPVVIAYGDSLVAAPIPLPSTLTLFSLALASFGAAVYRARRHGGQLLTDAGAATVTAGERTARTGG